MFNIFKKKTPLEQLYQQHEKLLKEAHSLSSVNRSKSDEKIAEAAEIMIEIQKLEKQS